MVTHVLERTCIYKISPKVLSMAPFDDTAPYPLCSREVRGKAIFVSCYELKRLDRVVMNSRSNYKAPRL